MFLRIRNNKPEVFDKIVPVFGDICREELGMVAEARKTLEEEVLLFTLKRPAHRTSEYQPPKFPTGVNCVK